MFHVMVSFAFFLLGAAAMHANQSIAFESNSDSVRLHSRKDLASPTLISNPSTMCINDPYLMPRAWRAAPSLDFLDNKPWSTSERTECDEATNHGLDELIGFFQHATERQIERLGVDAVNSLFDYVVTSEQETPEFYRKALHEAIRVIKITTRSYMEEYEDSCDSNEAFTLMKYVGYADDLHKASLPQGGDKQLKHIRDKLVKKLQNIIDECDSNLGFLIGDIHWREKLNDYSLDSGEVYEWNLGAIALNQCMTIPDLSMPVDTKEFVAKVWRYFYDYDIPGFLDYELRGDNRSATDSWVDMAYLATHVAYIPTGYGRHYQYLTESPHLYHFCRESFYAAMEEGGHDLAAEFVDMLKIYGCTEENDIQVRHGVRYIMSLYKEAGNSFVNHREEGASAPSDYDTIHKPWTGIAALWKYDRSMSFEPENPGSYGDMFRSAVKSLGYDSVSILEDDVEYERPVY
uniref:Uncharacterized protein n=1 Tax=Chaetoceros debilis TaxID=122233 RepID=A0A7S3QCC1_9STRA